MHYYFHISSPLSSCIRLLCYAPVILSSMVAGGGAVASTSNQSCQNAAGAGHHWHYWHRWHMLACFVCYLLFYFLYAEEIVDLGNFVIYFLLAIGISLYRLEDWTILVEVRIFAFSNFDNNIH